jgi:hypothetical protein
MISGIYMRPVVSNYVRVDLDDQGYGDVEMVENGDYSWLLYRNGEVVGSAEYDVNYIILKIKT